jgi:hypothetical protein
MKLSILQTQILIGSARSDENGKYSGGKAGDQKQKRIIGYDMCGEVSIQNMYAHRKGWLIIRPKSKAHAGEIANKMIAACNNANIGYDQNQRLGIITAGIGTKKPTDCDCSSLVRACIKEATGTDPGNFTTMDEAAKLKASGLFEEPRTYVSQKKTPVYDGDVLVTKTKGHTAIVVKGNPRKDTPQKQKITPPTTPQKCYKKYTGTSCSLVEALAAVGEKNTSMAYRTKIASANGIKDYTGTAKQNTDMVNFLKAGKLIRP